MNKVIAFQNGDVSRPSKKEGYHTVMIGCTSFTNIGGAFMKSSRRAFLRLPSEMLEALSLVDGDDINAKLKSIGQAEIEIIRTEAIVPFYEGQQPKVNPTTNEVVKDSQGNPIYFEDRAWNKGTQVDTLVSSQRVAVATEAGDVA